MRLVIELGTADTDRLIEMSKRLGVSCEELARAAVLDMLTRPQDQRALEIARDAAAKYRNALGKLAE